MHVICLTYFTLLDFVTQIIFSEECKLWSLLCSFLHLPITSSFIGPNISLSTCSQPPFIYVFILGWESFTVMQNFFFFLYTFWPFRVLGDLLQLIPSFPLLLRITIYSRQVISLALEARYLRQLDYQQVKFWIMNFTNWLRTLTWELRDLGKCIFSMYKMAIVLIQPPI
jgi:hypothetical protein